VTKLAGTRGQLALKW